MPFYPPEYEWSARNAKQALGQLDAARKTIEAYLLTLDPDGTIADRDRLSKITPAIMVLNLNMKHVVQAVADAQAIRDLDVELTAEVAKTEE